MNTNNKTGSGRVVVLAALVVAIVAAALIYYTRDGGTDALSSGPAKTSAAAASKPAEAVKNPSTPEASTAAPPRSESPTEAKSALLHSPAGVSTAMSVQRKIVEAQFAELMDELNFSSGERSEFIQLFTDARLKQMQLMPALMAKDITAEERAKLMGQIKDGDAKLDGDVRQLLKGEASYAHYRDYVDQQPDRTQVKSLQTGFNGIGQPISTDQAKALTAIMYEERRATAAPAGADDPAKTELQALAGAGAAEKRRESLRALQERVAARAAAVLTPEQLAVLKQQQRTKLESVGKMSKALGEKVGP